MIKKSQTGLRHEIVESPGSLAKPWQTFPYLRYVKGNFFALSLPKDIVTLILSEGCHVTLK